MPSAATVTLLAGDLAMTCRNLSVGGREHQVPSQNCGAIAAELAAERGLLWSGAYLAHRAGRHRIERLLEWIGPASNAEGMAYSLVSH
jgi:hypothetical protein